MSTTTRKAETVEQQIKSEVPSHIIVESVQFEGPELIIYTETPKEFVSEPGLIGRLAHTVNKRITVSPAPGIKKSKQEAREIINTIVEEEAGISKINFYDETSEVIIEAAKPGMVIGRGGELIQKITTEIGWSAEVLRTPPIESNTVRNVRNFLTRERKERREILERVGRQIHREPTADETHTRVSTLGCCREVGRAAFVLSTGESRILVDCGYKPGSDGEVPYLQVAEGMTAGAHSLDAVVLTHAHLDHSAFVPLLFKYGYDGPVFCTQPTRDLLGLLTLDYLKVSRKQGNTPPYDSDHIQEALKHTITIDYDTITEIAPDTRLTFQNAGHVLGSAVSRFHVEGTDQDVVFSGDIHYDDTRLFNGASNQFPGADALIMESTYGKRNDVKEDQRTAEEQLKAAINETYRKGGKTLIPSFAVGRSQEIMLVLEEAMRNNEIPTMPIHLDGMIWEATAIHTAYPEYLRDEVKSRIFQQNGNPFLFEEFNHISDEEERQRITDGGPCIIVSTSGMVAGGPIMSWLKHIAPDPDSSLVFVGYQAANTLGREIQQGASQIEMDSRGYENTQKQQVPINMGVTSVSGFSGHGDREELMDFVGEMQPQPDTVLCVHGDEDSVDQLSSGIYHEFGIDSIAPKNLETHRFD